MRRRNVEHAMEGARAYADFLENAILPEVLGTPDEEGVLRAIQISRTETWTLGDMVNNAALSSDGEGGSLDY